MPLLSSKSIVLRGSVLDLGNSSQTALGVDEEVFGTWLDTTTVSALLPFAFGLVGLATFELQWSSDGATPDTDLLATTDLTANVEETAGFFIYLPEQYTTTMIRRYVRVHIVNGSTAQTAGFYSHNLWRYHTGAYPWTMLQLGAPLGSLSNALLTRSVTAGVAPGGEFVNLPAGGEAFRYATNKLTDPDPALLAGETISSGWIDTSGQASVEIFAAGDAESAPDGIIVRYASDPNIPDEDQIGTPDFFEYTGADFLGGKFSTVLRSRRSYIKVDYVNGDDDQTEFEFTINVDPVALELPRTALDAKLDTQSEALTTKGGLVAADDAKDIQPIGRNGEGVGSLNVHVTQVDDEVGEEPDDLRAAFQQNITSAEASQVQAPPWVAPARARARRITNLSSDTIVYVGPNNTVTELSGDPILPLSVMEETYPDLLYAIAQSGGGDAVATDALSVDTVDSNTGVTDPNNLFADDAAYAIFDDAADTVTLSGFDATGGLTNAEITQVLLKFKGRKEAGAAVQPTAYDGSDILSSGSTPGGSPITTPGTIVADPTLTYFVILARENNAAALTSVTDTMGFTGFVEEAQAQAAESRISLIRMTGPAQTNGSISCFLSAASNHDVIAWLAVSNFGGVQATDTDSSNSAGPFSLTANGTDQGLASAAVAAEQANVTTPVTNYTTREQDGSTSNDDQTLWVGTRALTATGPTTCSGTLDGGGNDDMSAALITLLPADAADPVLVVSHSEGATQLVMTLDQETDKEDQADITTDANWTKALLDGLQVTVAGQTIGNADAQGNRVWLDVVNSNSVVRIGIGYSGKS